MPKPSEEMSKFIQTFTGNSSKLNIPSDEIVRRVLYPLVNEGFKILEEGIANDPGDIDIIYIYGYGFPPWRGKYVKLPLILFLSLIYLCT